MKEYKIALMGAGGVGKSSTTTQLVERLVYDRYYGRVIEDRYRKSFMYKNEECMLDVTAPLMGGEDDPITPTMELYINNIDGFVLVYSLIDYSSFEYIKTVREQIINIRGTKKVPIVLVGSKGDLTVDSRAVETSIAAELAATWPNCRFIETSALNHDEIESIFKHCLDAIEELRPEKIVKGGKKGCCNCCMCCVM